MCCRLVGVADLKVFPYLNETNIGALLPEALAADIETVLADQTSGVGADAAIHIVSHCPPFHLFSTQDDILDTIRKIR